MSANAGQKETRIYNRLTYYQPCNFINTDFGENVRVGAFTEIGPAKIGNNVIIGAFCFIPEGVTIEEGAWIGPRVTFTNDRFPPAPREGWGKTLVRKGARIGAGCVILCGQPGEVLEIGEGALIGAGSVVTKSVPAGETWCGNPARALIPKNGPPGAFGREYAEINEADKLFAEMKRKKK